MRARAEESGFWWRVTRPSAAVEDRGDRRRVRLLSLLLFVLTFSAGLGVVTRFLVRGDIGWEMVVAIPVIGLAYGLSRTRWHWVGATIGAIALSFPSFVVAFITIDSEPTIARHALIWLALPMLFTSFVMEMRGTVATNCLLLVAVAGMMVMMPTAHEELMMAFSILTVTAVLAVGAAAVHNADRRAIREQLAERRRVEEELRRAKDDLENRVVVRTAELEQAHTRLRRSQKMEAIGQLAGGVAHDFNNLLTVINGYVGMILSGMQDDHPLCTDLKAVREAGDRASTLTRQLLAFGRKQVLQIKVIDLNEIIDNMGKMLRRLIREDVALQIKPDVDLGKVEVDPGQMEQVIVNLVVNASDAMPKGGKLAIETAMVTRPTESSDEPVRQVVLSISDTGEGIPPEVQERVFDPFFTTKEPGQGTGLGLSTVYGIVRQSGGEIELESAPGEGTTFRVYLQCVERGNTAPVEKPREAKGGSETILLVEDEEAVRALTARMLQKLGYQVLVAENGLAALERCADEEQPIDLLLTDVVMPSMGGPECAARVREIRTDLPVLYMSGHADAALAPHGALEADVMLLHKPFHLRELAEHLRNVLDKESG